MAKTAKRYSIIRSVAHTFADHGGGLKTGVVVGSTNSKAEHPKDRPLEPNDLWATMFQHLGIDTEHAFPDHQGRPMPILATGAPISELV